MVADRNVVELEEVVVGGDGVEELDEVLRLVELVELDEVVEAYAGGVGLG